MSISVQQLKRILGSFSQIVAKDVSGIKTTYATKKDVEGFAKLSDLNNTYIRKGDIHTEDYVTNVIFRDAYQNRLVKKTDLPALDTIATKQEISDAVSAIQVPSIEGLAKESEVETKLADYAKTAEVAETYATKEAVNAINSLDADTIATLKNLSQHSDLTAIANKVDNVYTKAETDDKLATKADVSAIPSVEGLAKTTDIESTYAKKSELPDVSGLATKQEVTDAVAGVQVPSIEGLAKMTDVDAKLATKADVSAIPNISNLATKEEVATVDASFEKFGLNLGIKKETAEFYNLPIALADMIKGIVMEKFSYSATSALTFFSNKSRALKANGIAEKYVVINAIQNGTDFGYCHFQIPENASELPTITIPEGINLEEDYQLKAQDIFGVKEALVFTVKHSFESTAVEKLDTFISEINFETTAVKNIDPVQNLTSVDGVPIINTTDDINTTNFQYGTKYVVIKTKAGSFNNFHHMTADDAILFLTPDFAEYIDLGTGEWKAFPESEKEKVKKLSDRYTAKINE